jgi:putative transposase
MQTGHRFRLYPTLEQAQSLLQWIGCQRFIYNAKVGEDRYFRTFARKSLALAGQHGPIDQKYAQFIGEGTAWLRDVPSVVLRNGAVLWKQAYARYFRGLAGRPTIHKKTGRQGVWLTSELFEFVPVNDGYRLILGTKKFPVGEIALKAHRPYAIPASIHVSVHAGQWFVSFTHENDVIEPKEDETADWLGSFERNEVLSRTLGLDLGVKIKTAASDGQSFHFSAVHQEHLAKGSQRVKRWQRISARRQKGGANRRKANVRQEFAHQTSHALVTDPRYLLYVFEALKVKNMTRSAKGTEDAPGSNVRQKAGLNRSILESAWGQTKLYTQYKARRAGKLVVEVSPYHSSQECGQCGHTHPDNRPEQAVFVCQACGHTDHADRNAARVLQARGADLILSGRWRQKEKKRCAIRKQVERDSLEPASESRPTPTEFIVSRPAGNSRAQGTLKWEAPATTQRV